MTKPKTVTFLVSGIKEVDKLVTQLPINLERKVYRQSMRKALKPVHDRAKKLAPVLQKPKKGRIKGGMRKAIKLRSGKKSRRTIRLNIQLGSQGFYAGQNFYGAFQEFGWKWKANRRQKSEKRPVIPGKRFMRKAYVETQGKSRSIAITEIKSRATAEIKRMRLG